MNHDSESPPKRQSLDIADLNAMGFAFERDPLASANAGIAQSYFFIRPEQAGVPALRLNIARHQLVEGNVWQVSIADGSRDLASHITDGKGAQRRSADVSPEDVLATAQRFLAEVIAEHAAGDPRPHRIHEHVAATHDNVHRCVNCGQSADMGNKYCGLPNCDDVASLR